MPQANSGTRVNFGPYGPQGVRTMNCAKTKRILGLYLSGGLSEKDRRRVEAHIASCPRCAEEVRLYRASYDALDGVEDVRPSEDFQRKLRSRIRRLAAGDAETRPSGTRPARTPLRRAVAAAAACAALVLGLWLALRPGRTPDQDRYGLELTAQEEQEIIENLPLLENLDILEAAENGNLEIYKGEPFATAEILVESNIDEPDIEKIIPPNESDGGSGPPPSAE